MLNIVAPIITGIGIIASLNIAAPGRSPAESPLIKMPELPKMETILDYVPSREINTSV